MNWLLRTADRLESIYLAALRIGVLVVATLALLVAVVIAGDGLRSLLTFTEVKPEKVVVKPSELVAAVEKRAQVARGEDAPAPAISAATKKAHAAFLKGPFSKLYRLYQANARRYNKTEDKLLTPAEFADRLGYGLDEFDARTDSTVSLFANDEEYAEQLTAAVSAAAARPAFVKELQRYKAAQKTAKTCRTVYERRRGWDSSSMNCAGWYYTPIGCPVIREVPVQKCEPAYPADITSPVVAVANLDRGFRDIWRSKTDSAAETAALESADREALRATGVPKLTRASMLLGLFLGIMFLFLVIAVERHLRKLRDLTEMKDPFVHATEDVGSKQDAETST